MYTQICKWFCMCMDLGPITLSLDQCVHRSWEESNWRMNLFSHNWHKNLNVGIAEFRGHHMTPKSWSGHFKALLNCAHCGIGMHATLNYLFVTSYPIQMESSANNSSREHFIHMPNFQVWSLTDRKWPQTISNGTRSTYTFSSLCTYVKESQRNLRYSIRNSKASAIHFLRSWDWERFQVLLLYLQWCCNSLREPTRVVCSSPRF